MVQSVHPDAPAAAATAAALPPAAPLAHAHHILAALPPARFAFAYGSAVVAQRAVDARSRMIDLVVAVDDAAAWHAANLRLNPGHYALPMALLGADAIAATQRSFGARVYFNTYLPSSSASSSSSSSSVASTAARSAGVATDRPFKYGVVQTDDLAHDLLHWRDLYVAGRLHKPVRFLSTPPPSLADALDRNLDAAAAAALLSLPARFSETQLYGAIAALSYTGDVRTLLPLEVRSKTADIVAANVSAFRALYARTAPLRPAANLVCSSATVPVSVSESASAPLLHRDDSPAAQARLLAFLPDHTRRHAAEELLHDRADAPCPRTPADAHPARLARAVCAAVGATVARSSLAQSAKGLATAGVATSARYVAAKLRKTVEAAMRQRARVARVAR